MRCSPFLGRLLLFVLLPVLMVLLAMGIAFKGSVPDTSGEVVLTGLHAPVRVVRDQRGIPDIRARNDHDAFFALGYAHAQDRMWQMDYKRMLGQGRLSEVLGAGFLDSDKLMRTLGLQRAAQQALTRLSPDERLSLRAYADGVNAWIDGDHPLPVEYRYVGTRPEHWNESDSLLMVKLLALSLGGNYRQELANQVLVKHLGKARASELTGLNFTAASADAAPTVDAPEAGSAKAGSSNTDSSRTGPLKGAFAIPAVESAGALWRVSGQIERIAGLGGEGVGSNAWAVAGRHVDDGRPLLAGDPHLRNQLPSTFYLARLRGGRLDVAGATLPGVPVVVFGHNASIAWAGTNLAADAQDLYVERLAIDKEQYEVDGEWRPIVVRDEWIRVAPEFPAVLRAPYRSMRWRVRSTRNGPLISDAISSEGQALALRWSALDASDRSYAGFLAINYADGLDAFRAALREYAAPSLNFVYADRRGNIAMIAAGRIPVRNAGDGLLPAPGWDSSYRWSRYLQASELPAQVNPASGRVVSANQRIHGDDYPWLISNSWQPGYRADRIDALLASRLRDGQEFSVDYFGQMQRDVLEPQAAELLPLIVRARPRTEAQRELIERLSGWDRRMSEDSVGATLYHAWSRHFMLRLVETPLRVEPVHDARLGVLKEQAEIFRPELLRRIARGELRHWCGGSAQSCEAMALRALDDASAELRRLAGGDPDDWEWGRVQRKHLPHAPFTHLPLLGRLFDRRAGVDGGRYTIDVMVGGFDDEYGYVGDLGPAYRQIVPLGALSKSVFMIDSGQSGNMADAHYADLMEPHRLGRAFRIDGAAGETLTLRPRTAVAEGAAP